MANHIVSTLIVIVPVFASGWLLAFNNGGTAQFVITKILGFTIAAPLVLFGFLIIGFPHTNNGTGFLFSIITWIISGFLFKYDRVLSISVLVLPFVFRDFYK